MVFLFLILFIYRYNYKTHMHVFWETNCSSRKCMCSLGKWPFAPRNNQFLREIIPFLKENVHFPWGATSSPGEMHMFPEEQQVPPGRWMRSLGNTCNSPGNLLFHGKQVQFPWELVIPWETSAIPLGTYYFPKKQVHFPQGTFFP